MLGIQVNVSYVGPNNEVVVIDVKGYIDTSTAPDVTKIIEEHLSLGKYKIIVNLEEVDYISSAGWGVFVGEIKEIRENHGDLVLVNMSSNVYNIFELMELSSIIKSFEGVNKAAVYFLGEEAEIEEAEEIVEEEKTKSRPSKQKVPAKNVNTGVKAETPPSEAQKAAPFSPYIKEAEQVRDNLLSFTHTDLGKRILKVILEKPYFNVKDIARALRTPQFGGRRVMRIAVRRELKYMDLIDKKKRYEFAMKSKE